MRFGRGFRVSDFLSVGKLVWDVYSAYADAPKQFRDFSQEILPLHAVFEQVEEHLHNTTTLSRKNTNNLKTLYDGLKGIMEELDNLLKKYKSWELTSHLFHRLKWGQEDLVGLRERLRSNITLLTTFNASLANCQRIRIQKQLGEIPVAEGLHCRGSVASVHSITSFARRIGQGEAWKGLCRELHCNSITAEMINPKKDEIFKLLQTARIQSFIGNLDNGGVLQEGKHSLEGKQGKEIDHTCTAFDVVMNVLSTSTPAMQARYFVARLVGSKRASPLHMAAEKGQTNLVKALLDRPRSAKINATDANWLRGTALHLAAFWGNIEVVKLLLDRGAAIDVTTDNGWTAYHWAAYGGHIEVVKVMLDRGTAIDATVLSSRPGWPEIDWVDDIDGGHTEVEKVMLDRGIAIDARCTVSSGWPALHWAANGGHIEVVKVMLDRGAAIDATNDGWTALHLAALWGHIEVVKVLLDRGAAIDTRANFRCTAPYRAADRGHIEVVKVPLNRGAAMDATTDEDAHSWTALHVAALWGRIEVAKVLLDRGAAIDATTNKGAYGWTTLHLAADWGDIEIVKLMLDRGAGIDIDATGGWSRLTALHMAALRCHFEVVDVLLDRGAAIDAALHRAAKKGHSEVVQYLLNRGAAIDATADDGWTAVHWAAFGGHIKAMKVLLDSGANTDRKNADGETALDVARARWQDKARVVALLTATAHKRMFDEVLKYPLPWGCGFESD